MASPPTAIGSWEWRFAEFHTNTWSTKPTTNNANGKQWRWPPRPLLSAAGSEGSQSSTQTPDPRNLQQITQTVSSEDGPPAPPTAIGSWEWRFAEFHTNTWSKKAATNNANGKQWRWPPHQPLSAAGSGGSQSSIQTPDPRKLQQITQTVSSEDGLPAHCYRQLGVEVRRVPYKHLIQESCNK